MVSPAFSATFADHFDGSGIAYSVLIDDVGSTIEQTSGAPQTADAPRQLLYAISNADNGTSRDGLDLGLFGDSLSAGEFFKSFHPYAVLEAKLQLLAASEPRVQLNTIGKSTEGRNMYLVKVSSDAAGPASSTRPVIFIDAGHHAREVSSRVSGRRETIFGRAIYALLVTLLKERTN